MSMLSLRLFLKFTLALTVFSCTLQVFAGKEGGVFAQTKTKRPAKSKASDKTAPVYTVITEPPESEVIIDGKSRGMTTDRGILEIKSLTNGKHRLTVRHEGYKDNDQYITVAAGESEKVELEKKVLTLFV